MLENGGPEMKVYDISQEVFSSWVFPGDHAPKYKRVKDYCCGDLYAVTDFTMCAHNGTHVDVPRHFIADGKTVDEVDVSAYVGRCRVITALGNVTSELLSETLKGGDEKVCIRGDGFITEDGARELIARGIGLVGVEVQSVSDPDDPMAVHKLLLSANMILLEGIRLDGVADGEYFISAAPINLGGAEGAPCRAILIDGIL